MITVANKGTITYTYDAAGNKLKKVTVNNTGSSSITTTTLYIGGAVYENDQLQFIGHEEGRIRPLRDGSGNITSFTYDYFLKDHLGNVRMVLTEQEKTDMYPPASMETAQATTEEALYANVNTTRTDKPSGYPNDTYTDPNNKVAMTNGSGNKICPNIILKVMAGDKFNIRVSSWYKKNGATPNSPNSIATDLVTNLINSLTGSGGPLHGTISSTELTNSGVMPATVNSFLSNQPAPGSTKPKAYLNWVLLDEQFKFVQSSSGAEQVDGDQVFKVHTKPDVQMAKSGYLYVFVSNETPNIDVFFDNLQVTHIRGPILEETHYYPFGLTMAGISSKALNGALENKIKFQGQEFNDVFNVDYYEFKYRQHDPQIGRFTQIDPLADKYVYNSTYAFSENKVTGHIELEGLESLNINNISQIHRQSNTGKKDLSSIKLNLRRVISNTTSNYNTKYNKGKSDLISFVQRLNGSELTVNDVAQIKSVSETKLTTTSNIIDGKFLEMTTQTTITEVKLDVDEVTSITQTTSSTTSIMAIESIDSKDNSITVGISPISIINNPTKTSQINPGKDLSNLPPDLKNEVNLAIRSNNQAAFDKGKDVLKKALDAGKNLHK